MLLYLFLIHQIYTNDEIWLLYDNRKCPSHCIDLGQTTKLYLLICILSYEATCECMIETCDVIIYHSFLISDSSIMTAEMDCKELQVTMDKPAVI